MKRYQHKIKLALQQDLQRAIFVRYGAGKCRAIIQFLKTSPDAKGQNIIIFADRYLIRTWYTELVKWWPAVEVIPVDIFDEPGSDQIPLTVAHTRIFLCRTQAMLVERVWSTVARFNWKMCILDESTVIKNPKAQITKRMLQWAKMHPNTKRFILSGEPMPEGPHGIWSQLEFCYWPNNPLAPSYYQCLNRWFVLAGWNYALLIDRTDEFYKIINDHSIRLDEEDFAEFLESVPEVAGHFTHTYEPSPEQRSVLNELWKHWELPNEEENNNVWELSYATDVLLKELEICSGFWYDTRSRPRKTILMAEQPKLMAVDQLVQKLIKEGRSRIAIWHVFEAEEELLADALRHRLPVFSIKPNNLDILRHHKSSIFLVRSALARGLNDFADVPTAIIYTNSFKQEVRDQIEGRHRRLSSGKTPVEYYDVVSTDLADNYVATAIRGKALSEERLRAIAIVRKAVETVKSRSPDGACTV